MRFICFTSPTLGVIFINPDQIVAIHPAWGKDGPSETLTAIICMNGSRREVTGAPRTITEAICALCGDGTFESKGVSIVSGEAVPE